MYNPQSNDQSTCSSNSQWKPEIWEVWQRHRRTHWSNPRLFCTKTLELPTDLDVTHSYCGPALLVHLAPTTVALPLDIPRQRCSFAPWNQSLFYTKKKVLFPNQKKKHHYLSTKKTSFSKLQKNSTPPPLNVLWWDESSLFTWDTIFLQD